MTQACLLKETFDPLVLAGLLHYKRFAASDWLKWPVARAHCNWLVTHLFIYLWRPAFFSHRDTDAMNCITFNYACMPSILLSQFTEKVSRKPNILNICGDTSVVLLTPCHFLCSLFFFFFFSFSSPACFIYCVFNWTFILPSQFIQLHFS